MTLLTNRLKVETTQLTNHHAVETPQVTDCLEVEMTRSRNQRKAHRDSFRDQTLPGCQDPPPLINGSPYPKTAQGPKMFHSMKKPSWIRIWKLTWRNPQH